MLEIANDEAARRWEARLDGELAGYVQYLSGRGRIVFTHTVVEPHFEGRGGWAPAPRRAALDAAVAAGQRIVPTARSSAPPAPPCRFDAWVDWRHRRSARGGLIAPRGCRVTGRVSPHLH
jgi:predicted GNAT family acetyltransferase